MDTPPSHQRALVLETVEDGIQLKTVPTPQATVGSAVVRILTAGILSYHREIYDGTRQYPFPTPLVTGASAIARVASLGPDATSLECGQLIFVDCVIRGRDDPSSVFLSAIHEGGSPGSQRLMRDVWRDGMFAEYARVPLENCIPLNEKRLCGELGYTARELAYLTNLLVPYGGIRDIGVEPGQTIIVSPATGAFGGAGVHVAAAMGCKVIALGRNEKELARIKAKIESTTSGSTIITIPITSSMDTDNAVLESIGTVDAILDLSPPAAAQSPHMKFALNALKYEGKVSLMGLSDVTSTPEIRWKLIGSSITLKGKLMYSRSDMVQFVKMLETGLFAKGTQLAESKAFPLESWKEALDVAADWAGIGRIVVFEP